MSSAVGGSQGGVRAGTVGGLLTTTELENTAATRLAEEETEDLLDTLLGWSSQVGPDPNLAATREAVQMLAWPIRCESARVP
ncbi:hypothetical protein GCM10023086_75170 [Streptomyces venetus]|uniref:Uncharacterized protein n=1 Tax=Streptomyces venetus TaxID=1701086 RepID=A0ABP8HIP5_9ACTN